MSDHGYEPIYNPDDWPTTLKNLKCDTYNYCSCTEFPDGGGIEVNGIHNGSVNEAFCWRHAPAGTYLLTTAGCHLFEGDVKAPANKTNPDGTSSQVFFEDLLPWCGPTRPYLEYAASVGDVFDVYGTSQYNIPCFWKAPSKKASTIMSAAYFPHVYCWVEGDVYTNSSRWWESARLEYGEKCYFPDEYFRSAPSINMTGAGGPCDYGVNDPGWWEAALEG
ncbi:hypothetical protein G7Y89_g9744 [Cudoniella acicularis]|uniref:Uncharacterized protein n=1 Tax=Cudoniella acicularis TaxID=354080 RepID=A0A8H4RE37_9HELO|nr:hypothetical protein G7Y89_g9744 [Cudoniella acicularis]